MPCVLFGKVIAGKVGLRTARSVGLSNVAATNVNRLAFEAPSMWDESMLRCD